MLYRITLKEKSTKITQQHKKQWNNQKTVRYKMILTTYKKENNITLEIYKQTTLCTPNTFTNYQQNKIVTHIKRLLHGNSINQYSVN